MRSERAQQYQNFHDIVMTSLQIDYDQVSQLEYLEKKPKQDVRQKVNNLFKAKKPVNKEVNVM